MTHGQRIWKYARSVAVIGLLGTGAALIYLPAGLIVAGLLVLADVITD